MPNMERMDVEEILDHMRKTAQRIWDTEEARRPFEIPDALHQEGLELSALVKAMDEAMARGDPMPQRWMANRTR